MAGGLGGAVWDAEEDLAFLPTAIEAEGELVEVALQMLGADALRAASERERRNRFEEQGDGVDTPDNTLR